MNKPIPLAKMQSLGNTYWFTGDSFIIANYRGLTKSDLE